MLKVILLGVAAAIITVLGTTRLASADTDPFERLVSECRGVSLLYRVTEGTPIRLDLTAGVYGAELWTPIPSYDMAGVEIWGFGHDGWKKRSTEWSWSNLTETDEGFDPYGKFRQAFAAPGGMTLYLLTGETPRYYVMEIYSYDGCQEPAREQRQLPDEAFTVIEPDKAEDDVPAPLPSSNYEPITDSNYDQTDPLPQVWYNAEADLFTDRVRTDIRMPGPNQDLMLDAVCFDNGNAALGFRLSGLTRDENFAESLEVTWRIDSGQIFRDTLTVEYLGTTPAIYFRGQGGFADDWPNIFEGDTLAVRIGYRGVQEETFDLDLFRSTPVNDNLVHCGDY